jgi:hypothetical protein
LKPPVDDRVAQSANPKGVVTEPLLTLELEGEEFMFMADTGVMVSLISPE